MINYRELLVMFWSLVNFTHQSFLYPYTFFTRLGSPVVFAQVFTHLGSPVVFAQVFTRLGSPVVFAQVFTRLGSPVVFIHA